MNLSAADLTYVNTRLDEHELKYQEVYDEIKDHVLLAIEAIRATGDERDIEYVYNHMMDTQFPGYYAFEKIAAAYEKAYRAKIKKMVWANFRRSINPLNITVIVLSLILGYQMPETKASNGILISVLFFVSVLPVGYIYYKTRIIKTDDDKRSIVKDYVNKQSYLLILNYNIFSVILHYLNFWHLSSLTYQPYDPTVQILIISLTVIYGFSVIRLCEQEIKLPMLNTNNS